MSVNVLEFEYVYIFQSKWMFFIWEMSHLRWHIVHNDSVSKKWTKKKLAPKTIEWLKIFVSVQFSCIVGVCCCYPNSWHSKEAKSLMQFHFVREKKKVRVRSHQSSWWLHFHIVLIRRFWVIKFTQMVKVWIHKARLLSHIKMMIVRFYSAKMNAMLYAVCHNSSYSVDHIKCT